MLRSRYLVIALIVFGFGCAIVWALHGSGGSPDQDSLRLPPTAPYHSSTGDPRASLASPGGLPTGDPAIGSEPTMSEISTVGGSDDGQNGTYGGYRHRSAIGTDRLVEIGGASIAANRSWPYGNSAPAPIAPPPAYGSSVISAPGVPQVSAPASEPGVVEVPGQLMAASLPPSLTTPVFAPLPGAQTRGVSFSEWESSRADVAGNDIMVTFDDSNVFRDRNGQLNGNTGDVDASGLNVTDATDSVIHGSESADEAPWQTAWAAIVDILTGGPRPPDTGSDDDDDDGDADDPDPGANGPDEDAPGQTDSDDPEAPDPGEAPDTPGDVNSGSDAPEAPDPTGSAMTRSATDAAPAALAANWSAYPVASAAFMEAAAGGSENPDWDFPYTAWTNAISSGGASAIHTDEGTTLASGQDAVVVGGDGYDDDDIRAAGSNIVVTRDDGNVVIGGTGDVNSQIGDSEQGSMIMDVTRTIIQGGGAY